MKRERGTALLQQGWRFDPTRQTFVTPTGDHFRFEDNKFKKVSTNEPRTEEQDGQQSTKR